MNKIPREGEFCRLCPLLRIMRWENTRCRLWPKDGETELEGDYIMGFKRLPICLKECPQIITTGKEGE